MPTTRRSTGVLPIFADVCTHTPSGARSLDPDPRSIRLDDSALPHPLLPGWVGSPPPAGSEVFIGRLPQDVYEHQLIPLFQRVGRLYEFRLMMTFSGLNRGFAYARYSSRRGAQAAIATLHNHLLRPSCPLLVCRSTEKCELSVDGLPQGLSHRALLCALQPLGPGLQEALLLPSPGPTPAQIALLKFSSHRAAAMAKKALVEGRTGDCRGPLVGSKHFMPGTLPLQVSIVQQSGLNLRKLRVKFETDYLTSRFYISTGPTSYQ